MARVKIREFDAKKLITENLSLPHKGMLVDENTNLEQLSKEHPWLLQKKLVIKPDQLFGKRRKLGLVLLNADFQQVKEYLKQHLNQEITIGKATDKLTHFLIEPYLPHEKEYYLCITSERDHDTLYLSEEGGINVEENWDKVQKIEIPTLTNIEEVNLHLLPALPETVISFVKDVFKTHQKLHFTYLEINPFIFDSDNNPVLLDTVAHVDSQAINLSFPKPFGRKPHPKEEFIASLDKDSGASLKLTILNPQGRIWNILSGGGASIIYLDTIANLGKQEEIANYGEYSGNPTAEETYQYAKTILDLMSREYHPQGKILIIGGAIANFTDVEKTFTGIIKALKEYQIKLQEGKISIFVRRGGPNCEKGLRLIKQTGKELGIPMLVHGPDIPMIKIAEKAVGAL